MQKVFSTEPVPQGTIDAWKAEHKSVFAIDVPSSDDEGAPLITGYFRKPTIDEMGLVTANKEVNAIKASRTIYNTCLLGGHSEFEKDDDVILAALAQFSTIIKTREATIKKV